MYIISQVIGILALIITLISYHLKTKKQIFKGMCVANVLDITHYVSLNAYGGYSTKIVALIRNIFILKKEDKIICKMYSYYKTFYCNTLDFHC